MKTSDHLRRFRALIPAVLALVIGLGLWAGPVVAPAWAEETAPAELTVDYAEWEKAASGAEDQLENRNISDERLDELRNQLAKWRATLLNAQNVNSTRIATVKEQIAALGPAPEEGKSEAPEIATRRSELGDLLGKLQAPGIAAEEAYRRADGLIREIDRTQRERQADKLLQLWPAPVNPANWPEAAVGISDTLMRILDEGREGWQDKDARAIFFSNLPLILGLVLLWAGLTFYARRWIENFVDRMQTGASEARRRVLSMLASTGQVLVPTAGMVALTAALLNSGLLGEVTRRITLSLPFLGFTLFVAAWLGGRAFPRQQGEDAALPLPPESRTEGRFMAQMLGLVIAVDMLRGIAMDPQSYSEAVSAVASFPILVAGGLVLYRIGRVLRLAREAGAPSYVLKLLSILAKAVTVIGFTGPALAAFGYVAAARALIFPAILTLGLITLLLVLQRLLADLWSMVTSSDDAADREGLVPVLIGFGLTLLAIPVFVLIWGARLADLTEIWTRFREGFQMGETRISPTDFLLFAVIFALGYMLTRLFQGALRTSILPRTRMDRGGQTALVSGTGYVGIFLAALVAIKATGIDLSGLAIVAGALSVGIGFGLQNIVSNFVSGIILLIERPVSEGDWIEVGGVQGTVKSISVRSTRVQTFDRTMVIVPNADLVSQQVKNWTRFGLAGRLIVPVGVAFGSDTRKVEAVLREIAEAQPLVVLNPPPLVLLQGFGADAMMFEIRVILRDVNFSLSVKNEINHQIVKRFEEEGIEIPFAQSDVTLRNADEIVAALAALRGIAPSAPATPAVPETPVAPVLAEEPKGGREGAADPT